MFILRYIATLFINFFSITQPTPEARNRAAVYIGILLAAVLAFVIILVAIGAHVFHHSTH